MKNLEDEKIFNNSLSTYKKAFESFNELEQACFAGIMSDNGRDFKEVLPLIMQLISSLKNEMVEINKRHEQLMLLFSDEIDNLHNK